MIKKSFLAIIALSLCMCSSTYGQFITISPSDLLDAAPQAGQTFSVSNRDISSIFGLNAGELTVSVSNAVVAQNTDFFAVNESNSTLFAYGGSTDVRAFVQHGRVLGNNFAAGQPTPRDGVSSSTVFDLDTSVTTSLDANYQFGSTATDYFVEYTGPPNSNPTEQNSSSDFRFVSDGPVSNFTVFSDNNNGNIVNNNFSTGLQLVAVPEPAAGMILALGGLFALRRKRS